jgi:hypothetical protein
MKERSPEEGGDDDDEDQACQRHRDDQTALTGIHATIVVTRFAVTEIVVSQAEGNALAAAISGDHNCHGPPLVTGSLAWRSVSNHDDGSRRQKAVPSGRARSSPTMSAPTTTKPATVARNGKYPSCSTFSLSMTRVNDDICHHIRTPSS